MALYKKKVIMLAAEEVIRDQRVLKEAGYISSRGYDVEILCWDRQNEFISKPVEVFDNIKVRRFFPKSKYGSGMKQLLPFFRFFLEISEYLKDVNFEILHCQNLDAALLGCILKGKRKLIFDMREFYIGRERLLLKKLLIVFSLRICVKFSFKAFYVNSEQLKDIDEIYHDRFVFLPNYPLLDLCNYVSKPFSPSLRIGYIGGVRQYDIFVNLFEAVHKMQNVKVYVHGNGIDYLKLKSIENNYDNIFITGKYDPKDTGVLFQNIDILYCVFPTENKNWQKGFSIKFYEAIATNTPIIVNKNTNMADFVHTYDVGFTVDGSDRADIASLILSIAHNSHILIEKQKNIAKIQHDFLWNNIVERMNCVYI